MAPSGTTELVYYYTEFLDSAVEHSLSLVCSFSMLWNFMRILAMGTWTP